MKWVFRAILLLVAGATLLAANSSSPVAADNGLTGKILFTSGRDGNGEIYVMNADGTGQTRLTFDPAHDFSPRWSPDGIKIAFVKIVGFGSDGYEIYVMNADGTGQVRLTNNSAVDDMPAWSPDGTKIAFVSARDGLMFNIYVMNADGSGATRLTEESMPTTSATNPTWSPEGTKIAFGWCPNGQQCGIWVMNADGTSRSRLVASTEEIVPWMPKWSPDGSKILFVSLQGLGIYVVNADGSGLRRVPAPFAADAAWSPDGTKIIFVRLQPLTGTNTGGISLPIGLSVVKVDGTGLFHITDHEPGFGEMEPDWWQPLARPATFVNLAVGWNPVVYNGTPKPVEQALNNCLSAVDAVFQWNNNTWSYWFRNAPAGFNTLKGLITGNIVWVSSNASCSWQQK